MSEIIDNLKEIRGHLDAILARMDRMPTKAQVLVGAIVFMVAFLAAVVVLKRLI